MNINNTKIVNPLRVVTIGILMLLHVGLIAQPNSKVSSSLDNNPIKRTIELIQNSQKQIQAVVYKFEVESVLDALIKAYERGVKIQIIVDAKEAKKTKSLVKQAKGKGVKIRKWKHSKMHAKFTIIDEKIVITGSFNWTKTAKKENLELIVLHEDQDTADSFVELFKDIWKKAKEK
ncbi:MAG: hypothetical protein DRI95_09520 [Bacteroidetes bacterium]|nr:MAG: hypothetical protein DRI95_09520 [Bacteroidota bacterium]